MKRKDNMIGIYNLLAKMNLQYAVLYRLMVYGLLLSVNLGHAEEITEAQLVNPVVYGEMFSGEVEAKCICTTTSGIDKVISRVARSGEDVAAARIAFAKRCIKFPSSPDNGFWDGGIDDGNGFYVTSLLVCGIDTGPMSGRADERSNNSDIGNYQASTAYSGRDDTVLNAVLPRISNLETAVYTLQSDVEVLKKRKGGGTETIYRDRDTTPRAPTPPPRSPKAPGGPEWNGPRGN